MLSYDFGCRSCQHVFEIFRSIKDDSPVVCTRCQCDETVRLFLQAPAILTGNSSRRETALDAVPGADSRRRAADRTINKVLKDMGRS